MMLQLGSSHGWSHLGPMGVGLGVGIGGGYGVGGGSSAGFPLGLSLEQGKAGLNDALGSGRRFFRDDSFDSRGAASAKPGFHGQAMTNTVPAAPQPPAVRPRVRARRGQATDPHSIAERLRRERIAERIRALVPSVNKTDRAAMLDEIVDYVKFLRLQVKVLSMSRLGGAGAVAPLVTDIPLSSVENPAGLGEVVERWYRTTGSWKKMWVPQCNFFNPRHSALCQYLEEVSRLCSFFNWYLFDLSSDLYLVKCGHSGHSY